MLVFILKQLTIRWDGTLLEGNVLDRVENKRQIIFFAGHGRLGETIGCHPGKATVMCTWFST